LSLPAAAHAGFCFCIVGSLAVKTKPARAALSLNKKTRQEKRSPKLYLHNASYTQPIFSAVLIFVFRLPITGIMYSGLSPNSRTPYALEPVTKTAKKQSKGMQAPHWPTRSKKARPRQVPVKFLI
jgi:hypothetical protein